MRSRPSSAGYTAVEIMMALTVMTIGAAAVMSLQKTSVTGNFDARETDLAASIMRTWVDRLHADAMNWTQPNNTNPAGNNFANAKLLSDGPTNLHNAGNWGLPSAYAGLAPPNEPLSYAFDMLGRDIPDSLAASNGQSPNPANPVVFCVNYRLQWLVPQNFAPAAGSGLPVEPGLIRVDLRVLWPRDIISRPTGHWCADVATAVNPESGSGLTYHSLYLTTTIRQGGTGQ